MRAGESLRTVGQVFARGRMMIRIAAVVLLMLPLGSCLAGAVVGAAVDVTGAVVGTTVKTTGAVIDAAIPDGDDEDEDDDDRAGK